MYVTEYKPFRIVSNKCLSEDNSETYAKR